MSRLVLDAGAFVAFERGEARIRAKLAAALRLKLPLVTTSPVVAQVWRDGRRQALLSTLLHGTEIVAPDETAALRAGELLAKTRTTDVVDALLVALARAGDAILTSDPGDIARLLAAMKSRVQVIAV